MLKYIFFSLCLLAALCSNTTSGAALSFGNTKQKGGGALLHSTIFPKDSIKEKTQFLLRELGKPISSYIMVAAHRGDWRNAPENSIAAMKLAAAMGADIIEVDVKKTKDNVLIAMHDGMLDRTTTGKGPVKDFTWDQLKGLKLRSGNGSGTRHTIPTLKEFMQEALKLGVLVNLDKGIDYAREIGELLEETGAEHIAIVKSGMPTGELKTIVPFLKNAHFMPVISLDRDQNPRDKISQSVAAFKPRVMEISFQKDTSFFFNDPSFLTRQGVKIWNTPCSYMWCASHDDETAVDFKNPEGSWEWLVKHGATIMLTDRPRELIRYLEEKGLRKRD